MCVCVWHTWGAEFTAGLWQQWVKGGLPQGRCGDQCMPGRTSSGLWGIHSDLLLRLRNTDRGKEAFGPFLIPGSLQKPPQRALLLTSLLPTGPSTEAAEDAKGVKVGQRKLSLANF